MTYYLARVELTPEGMKALGAAHCSRACRPRC